MKQTASCGECVWTSIKRWKHLHYGWNISQYDGHKLWATTAHSRASARADGRTHLVLPTACCAGNNYHIKTSRGRGSLHLADDDRHWSVSPDKHDLGPASPSLAMHVIQRANELVTADEIVFTNDYCFNSTLFLHSVMTCMVVVLYIFDKIIKHTFSKSK